MLVKLCFLRIQRLVLWDGSKLGCRMLYLADDEESVTGHDQDTDTSLCIR